MGCGAGSFDDELHITPIKNNDLVWRRDYLLIRIWTGIEVYVIDSWLHASLLRSLLRAHILIWLRLFQPNWSDFFGRAEERATFACSFQRATCNPRICELMTRLTPIQVHAGWFPSLYLTHEVAVLSNRGLSCHSHGAVLRWLNFIN